MDIIVKPEHLKGNTFEHTIVFIDGRMTIERCCPLHEAIKEAGYKEVFVGYDWARMYKDGNSTLYDLSDNWTEDQIRQYIVDANKGDEKTITVTLTERFTPHGIF